MKRAVTMVTLIWLGTAQAAQASPFSPQPNLPPAPGALLDLAGQPLPTEWTEYTTDFVATQPFTDLTFAFRNDAGFTGFDDARVIDLTSGSASNLLVNGGFETGDLAGWQYMNAEGTSFSGFVSPAAVGCPGYGRAQSSWPFAGGYGWCDGSTQAYDAIGQTVSTTLGHLYSITFYQNQVDTNLVDEATYLAQSTNTCDPAADTRCTLGTLGNGIDTLVYVGSAREFPQPVPEPATIVLLGAGLLLLVRGRQHSA
jgi:hypothetical protein